MRYYLYIFVMLLTGTVFGQDLDALFDEASQQYNDKNYEAAITNYEHILEEGQTSVEVYYNLANAYYKVDSIAPSIFYYHKALQISPDDDEVQNNLRFAQEKTIDVIDEKPKAGINYYINSILSIYSFNTWAKVAIFFSFLFLVLGLGYYFIQKSLGKRILFMCGIIVFIFMIASVFFAYKQLGTQQSKQYAVVFAKEVTVFAEPNPNSEEAFQLHEGTRVKVLDDFSGFSEIQLADDSKGWVESEAVRSL